MVSHVLHCAVVQPKESSILSEFTKNDRKFLPLWYTSYKWLTVHHKEEDLLHILQICYQAPVADFLQEG